MSVPKLIVIGVSISLVGAAVLLTGSPRRERPTAQASVEPRAHRTADRHAASSSRTEPALAQELAELRHEVRHLDRVKPDPEAAAHAPDPTEAALELDAPPAPVVTSEQAEAQVAAVAEALEQHLADDPFDAEASTAVSAHLQTTLDPVDAQLLEAECGQTLCRTRLGFTDVEGRDRGLRNVGGLIPWEADGFLRTDPQDELRVSVYFTREGQPLPPLDDLS